jgi:hypothetical protein
VKTLVGVLVTVFLAVPAFAQVTCSPAVKPAICKEVASLWNPLLNGGLMGGSTIPAELMSDEEHKKRQQEYAEDEKRGNIECRRQCFHLFRHHVLNGFSKLGGGRIALVRDRPSSSVPDRIVVSTAAFNRSDLQFDDKTREAKFVDTGEYDNSKVIDEMKYIVGYFAAVRDALLETISEP